MSVYAILDTTFDVVMVVLGIMLIVRASGNRMRFFWGIMALVIGAIFLRDNLELILHPGREAASHGFSYAHLLVPGRMLEWLAPAVACSLFPLLSLRPGFFTPVKLVLFAIPVGATLLIGWCYDLFNGHITPLFSLQDVAASLGEVDVRLRLVIFAMTVLVPAAYFLVPVLGRFASVRRKATPMMWVFIAGMMFCMGYYATYMLSSSFLLFSTVNLVIEAFCILFAVVLLFYENPLSLREPDAAACAVEGTQTLADLLYCRMEAWFAENHPYADPDYAMEDMARDVNAKPSLVAEAIRSGGFTGFREYVNFLRVNYFKELADTRRGKSVKELMNLSGFTSRSSFYRLFSLYENATPSEYIEQLYRR